MELILSNNYDSGINIPSNNFILYIGNIFDIPSFFKVIGEKLTSNNEKMIKFTKH